MILLSRDLLYNRHRLSHQQIDDLLGENYSGEYLAEKLQQMEMVKEFILVTDSLKEAEIKFIPFKGPVLSYRLYKDATHRIYTDLDLFMDVASVEKAIDILSGLGYETTYHKWPENDKSKAVFLWHRTQFNMWHQKKGVAIELHWKLFFNNVNADLINQLITSNQTEMGFSGRKFTVFNKEFELLYLIIHGGLHNWTRLKWLLDIDRLLKVYKIDEDKFLQLSKTIKAGRLVALCNAMLATYFPNAPLLPQYTKAPGFLIDFTHSQIKQEKVLRYDSVSGFIKYYWARMSTFPGLSYKISIMKYLLFMPEDMDNEQLPSNTFLYYLIGPYNKIKRSLERSSNSNHTSLN